MKRLPILVIAVSMIAVAGCGKSHKEQQAPPVQEVGPGATPAAPAPETTLVVPETTQTAPGSTGTPGTVPPDSTGGTAPGSSGFDF